MHSLFSATLEESCSACEHKVHNAKAGFAVRQFHVEMQLIMCVGCSWALVRARFQRTFRCVPHHRASSVFAYADVSPCSFAA